MTGIDMVLGTVGASICLGCVTLSGWVIYQSIKLRDDETASIYLLASAPIAVGPLPIAWWVPAEAWVCSVTVYIVSAVIYTMRRLVE